MLKIYTYWIHVFNQFRMGRKTYEAQNQNDIYKNIFKSFGPSVKHRHVIIGVSQIHDFYLIFNIHFSYMTCGKVLQFHTDWSLYKYKYR